MQQLGERAWACRGTPEPVAIEAMNCYICAYKGSNAYGSALPSGSPAAATDVLGACYSCFVLACSSHASRAGQYQCVICQHTAALIFASSPPPTTGASVGGPTSTLRAARPAGAAAAAEAYLRGRQSPEFATQAMSRALQRLQGDAHQARERSVVAETVLPSAEATDEPNIIANFPEAVSVACQRQGIRSEMPQGAGGLSLEAIGAAARETFFPVGTDPSFGPNFEQIALGALIGALSVADDQPITPHRLPSPWEVAHPELLDPVMWLLGTAYTSATAEAPAR